jgi:peptidoglycan/LPS O-acetylase OafA/YrhL
MDDPMTETTPNSDADIGTDSEPRVDPPVEVRSETTSTGVHRLRFLDGVRGLAALYVVISHIWDTAFTRRPPSVRMLRDATAFLGFGRFAVTVFILVSGYSIGLAAWRGGLRWPGGTGRYIRRRTTRIWPPYAVAVLLSSLIAATVLSSNDGTLFDAANNIRPWGVITNLLLIQDIHWAGPAGSTAFWSIAVEFHIYFFFILVLICLRQSLRLAPVFIFGLIALTALAVGFPGVPVLHWIAGLTPSLYALFIIGFLAGRPAVSGIPFSERKWHRLLIAIFVAGLIVCVLDHRHWIALSQLNDFIVGPIAAFLLTSLTLGRLLPLARVLTSKIAVWLGDCSYSLYLIHAVVIEAVWRVLVAPVTTSPALRLILELIFGLAASIAVARVFYVLVERPFLYARERPIRARPPAAVASEPDGHRDSQPVAE